MKYLHKRPAGLAGILSLTASIAIGLSCGDRDAVLPTALPEPQAGAMTEIGAAAVQQTAGVIAFVSAGSQHSSGSSIALPRPASLQPGDVMIAQVVTPGDVRVSQAPAGWTQIRGDHNATHSSSWVYWKRAGDSEPSSYTWNLTASSRTAGGIAAYRGVTGGAAPIEAHGGQHTSSGTNIVAPSVTTTTSGAWLVALYSAGSEPRETNLAFTPHAGMTEHYDVSSQMKGNQRNVVAMQASAALAATGATGARTAVLNAARPGWGQLLALVPGPAAPPPPPPSNRPPVASAGGPYTGQEGKVVAFDGSASTDPDGDALTFSWSFGDGNSGTGAKPSHTYVDNGSFAVVLTVTDSHGATHQSATTATIANVPPTATLTLSAASVSIAQSVTATGSFSDPGTADAPWSWEIEWGDGSRTSGTASAVGGAISAQHAWTTAATYTVRLSVTDKDGGKGTGQTTVIVTDGGGTDTWHTDFSEHVTGQLPAGWSQPYATGNWHVAELAGSTGGKVLRNTIPVKDFFVLRWDAPGAQTDVELEGVARVVDGRNGSMGLVARGQAGRSFYTLRLDEGTSQWRLARYTSGSSYYFAQWNNPFPAGTWVSRRFRVEGNTLKAKIWAAGTPEPAEWTLQAVDPTPLGAGFAGVFMRVAVTTNDFDWVRVTAIRDPSPPPPPATGVAWAWSGAQTPQGAMVRVRLSAADNGARLRISTDSLFRTWTETAPAATGGNDVATFNITGLSANTRYHYRPVVGGVDHASFQGAFRTLPPAGSAHSFTFALGACQLTETTSTVFDNIRATAPLFWLQTGDIHYRNIAVNNIDTFRHAYNSLHDHAPQAALFRSTPIVHVWDDHDGAGGNDTDRTKTGWPAVKAAYRENVPHHPLAEGTGGAIHHSFVVGRVRFIVSDLRSERSPKSQLDDSRKTMLGATQKAHLKAELADAKASGQFIAWVTSVPWIAAPTAGADHWAGYDTERRELAAWIESLGISGQMFALAGDMHATAIDTGANNQWGGFPIFHAAPIHQVSSTKGGPYTHGPFTTTSSGGQFGVVTITDNGGSTIEVTFNGRRFAGGITGATHTFTLQLQ